MRIVWKIILFKSIHSLELSNWSSVIRCCAPTLRSDSIGIIDLKIAPSKPRSECTFQSPSWSGSLCIPN